MKKILAKVGIPIHLAEKPIKIRFLFWRFRVEFLLLKKHTTMKKVIYLVALAAMVLGTTSCKKCIECSYTAGGAIRSQEICGSSKAVDDAKTKFEAEGAAENATVTCIDK